jgi:hypothetical protein
LHYDEAVFCAAGKIVAKLDAEAAQLGTTWSSIHVRHGELQYTNVQVRRTALVAERRPWRFLDRLLCRSLGGFQPLGHVFCWPCGVLLSSQISPLELLAATSPWLDKPGELLYVATDEPDLNWFAPLGQRHGTRFLRDYVDEVAGLPNDWLGLVEQVVLAHGRTFTGTWFSTFSAYVCRLRGYYATHGDETCYVYAPDSKRFDFAAWKMPSHAFYPREWALAWEGIDYRPPRDLATARGDLPTERLEYQVLKVNQPLNKGQAAKVEGK